MAKLTLSDLGGLNNETSAVNTINNNNAAIETALENTLSRDGTSPNQMGADLDMNSNQILNLPEPTLDHEPATKGYVNNKLKAAIAGTNLDSGLSLNIAGLTELSLVDDAADYFIVRDTSSTINKKVLGKNLGFTQAGTGAAIRSIQSKFRDTVSVKDFGAVGDGTTDDTAAIQAAVTYAATIKSVAYAPATTGGYLSGTINFTDFSGLKGDDTRTKFVVKSGTDKLFNIQGSIVVVENIDVYSGNNLSEAAIVIDTSSADREQIYLNQITTRSCDVPIVKDKPFTLNFTWDTNTSASDPGASEIKCNNASLASATALYINKTAPLAAQIANIVQGTVIRLTNNADRSADATFAALGVATDNTTYYTVNVTPIFVEYSPSAADSVELEFDIGYTIDELFVKDVIGKVHNADGFRFRNAYGFIFFNQCFVDFVGVSAANYTGFDIRNTQGLVLDTCEVTGTFAASGSTADSRQRGFVIRDSAAAWLRRCFADTCGGEAFRFINTSYCNTENCTSSLCDGVGFRYYACSDHKSSNNTVVGRNQQATKTSAIHGVKIEKSSLRHKTNDWYVRYATGSGIYIDHSVGGCAANIINGALLAENTRYGIETVGTTGTPSGLYASVVFNGNTLGDYFITNGSGIGGSGFEFLANALLNSGVHLSLLGSTVFTAPTINGNLIQNGYVDLAEVSVPSSPSSNVGRLFAYDDANITRLAYKDSAGSVTPLSSAIGKNRLINGNFRLAQRGAGSYANGAYGFDRWIHLNQANPVTNSLLLTPVDGANTAMRITQSDASAQRFGIAQWIEYWNSTDLRGQKVSLSGKLRCSASTTIRYAILEWTGTLDTPGYATTARDPVNNWTSGTFTVGNFFKNTTTTVAGTGSIALTANTWADITPLTATISASMNNVIVMFWTDSTQAQNVTLDFTSVQLEKGPYPTSFEHLPIQTQTILAQRYYEKLGISIDTTPADGASNLFTFGQAWSVGNITCFLPYKVPKRLNSGYTVTFYRGTDGGTAGQWAYLISNWADATATTVDRTHADWLAVRINKSSNPFTLAGCYGFNGGATVDNEI